MKKKFMENKILYILVFIILVSVVFIGVSLVKYFYFGDSNKYGSRLTGIEEHKLPANLEKKLNELYTEDTSVNKVSYNLKGKLIYVTIDYKEALKLSDAQSKATKSLEAFDNDELSFYDVQLILTADTLKEKSDNFPTMGYKNASSENIVWIRG